MLYELALKMTPVTNNAEISERTEVQIRARSDNSVAGACNEKSAGKIEEVV